MKLDDSEGTLVDGALSGGLSPDWSPDGKMILYTADTNVGFELHTIPGAGGASQPIIRNGQYGRWSPDGGKIIFTGAGWGIFRINSDGGDLSVVDGSKSARMPDWQP